MKLSDLSDRELLRGLVGLVATERKCVARVVAYLVEVEERRLHLVDACSSLFDFCRRRLGLSEGEAFRRITAARLVQRFPTILGRIERGELHLSALALLAKHLTNDNHEELLRAASHKSKRKVDELLAARFPKDDVPTSIRLLPATTPPLALEAPSVTASTEVPTSMRLPISSRAGTAPTKSSIEPLSPARYKVQFTANQELRDKLDRATRLMSHRNPTGDLAVVVNDALDLLIAQLEKRRLGKTTRPRPGNPAKSGHVTRSALRKVIERDGERCTFVNEAGERCPATAFLEVDHIHARAKGGTGAAKNLRVLCRAHNQLVAEQAFGREHIARKIHLRRNKSRSEEPSPSHESFELASRALTTMGFREKEARDAVLKVRHQASAAGASMTVEAVLRHALAILTPCLRGAHQLECADR
jgi:hypothetical protein